ncbi:MAG TPA: hypothetical protein PK831_02230 [Candidatus Magasanikbacteria bacterium]|jgi:hypothetical protein|nr:hypothetical protein [Candidatus Magasanikbacteria bacterium]HQL52546.1 hypothetical protein [Candidatus Magasanikbacteria bacterium]
MFLGPFYIDLDLILQFFLRPTFEVVFDVVIIIGWVVLAYLLFFLSVYYWIEYKTNHYTADWKWVLLAIDVPLENVQTPKAVEQLFAHLAGAFDSLNIEKVFKNGVRQRWFSFEIISIEGYIQFLVRTEEIFRDLIEAAIYAQYPDADITEVEDYVDIAPEIYPDPDYDVWVGDFSLAENDAFPIRTYRYFEHNISKDTVLKDPMSAFLESFSRIGSGEQMWFQIIIEPISNSWKEDAIKKIKEVIGDVSTKKKSGFGLPFEREVAKTWDEISAQVFGTIRAENGEEKSKQSEPNQLKYLTPGQTKIVEAMEEKITKVGFKTKMRGVYLARNEVFKSERGINALVGAIQQFNIPSANSIVPKFTTSVFYFGKEKKSALRKANLIKAYKKRKIKTGSNPFVLNTEELATIWHFPMSHVKTPQVQKTISKRSEPPVGLPIESIYNQVVSNIQDRDESKIIKKDKNETTKYQTDSGSIGNDDNIIKFG